MKTMTPYLLALALPLGALFSAASAEAKMVDESWYLEGPHNGADVKRVERAVKDLPGVKFCEVSQATLDIRFDDQKLTDARLRSAVAQAGPYRLNRPGA